MRIIIKDIRYIKQTVLLLAIFLTLNIDSMVAVVARSKVVANVQMIAGYRGTCSFLQKTLSGGVYVRMLSTGFTKRDIKKDGVRAGGIEEDLDGMVKECNKCSLLPDVLSKRKCIQNCVEDYSRQQNDYLERECTRRCTGGPFDEKFRYKTESQERRNDELATLEARELWKDYKIRKFYVLKNLRRFKVIFFDRIYF